MNISTLFAANILVLLVTAFAFGTAWRGQRDRCCWQSWIAANITLAAALLLFLFAPDGRAGIAIALGNGLLIVGFGLRWRAARQFAKRPAPLAPSFAPALVALPLFAAPMWFDHAFVYTAINIILTAQAAATGHEFWRDRGDNLPSRYGLAFTYFLMAASFGARVGQGLVFGQDFAGYLPHDAMLMAHLWAALVYTTGSAAFLLSLAYESGAVDLRRAAFTDPLTALPNRRAFDARLQRHLAAGDARFGIVLFDIDHFKAVNDRHGHAVGDAALRACAQLCARNLRPSDFIARIGGEEFAAILPDTDVQAVHDLTERIRRAVEAHPIQCDGIRINLTLSAGIAHAADSPPGFDALMRAADMALYRAKAAGRNRIMRAAA